MVGVEHFGVAVVGSGFGGSASAFRFADAGLSVCVLERGKAYAPGDFPRSPRDMAANFWDPSKGLHGMFDVWSFRGIDAVVSSGLGGGSLIYANVLLRKDEHWFVHEQPLGTGYEHWPISRADLDPHYDRVEAMLDAQRYPFDRPPYADTPKTRALREAAGQLGLGWQLPKLAVSFAGAGAHPGDPLPEAPYPNIHGRRRSTCRLVGECDIGCNVGAKNTLDHTYLSAAAARGAQVRTGCEVRHFAPLPGGGFRVDYVEHDPAREGEPKATGKLPLRTLTADRLVLAAGALGTPYLLLRNRRSFPGLGPALGTRFCGNGDLLGFMIGTRTPDGAVRHLDASRGPVITSTIRVPDEVDGGSGRGYYLQDAGYPQFVNWLLEASQAPGSVRRAARFVLHRLWATVSRTPRSDIGAALSDLLGDASLSSSSMPLLGMGRDVPDGVMRLRRNYLNIEWTTATSQSYFDAVRSSMQDIARVLGGQLRDNPTYRLKRVVTVHPLGGAPMGRHVGEGVVDGYGESFAYPGLFVADGAAMPGPVGPNPALTIAAFADRMAERILERAEVAGTSSLEPRHRTQEMPVPATTPTSLEFTEDMKGFAAPGATDHAVGFDEGRQQGHACMFHLTIRIADVDAFLQDPTHEAIAEGWVEYGPLGGRLPVVRGIFHLFVEEDDPARRRMLYRLFLVGPDGDAFTLNGYKDIHDDPGFDVWRDTSTLYTQLLRGHVGPLEEDGADVLASGVLHILKRDFARQMTTFRTEGPTAQARARALSDFGRLFLGELWRLYGPKLGGAGARR
ncbi:GMC oxidoreductase [Egicoccus sp. AB-alg6-2]|uniref:GMC oxidoreductase n=1 Tax=Egicoccus sp. AB-alg6-2 TaxID=3242692 RepID=UPI00359E1904